MFIEKERRTIKKFVNVFTCDDVQFLYTLNFWKLITKRCELSLILSPYL
jgi:hypothetical protein